MMWAAAVAITKIYTVVVLVGLTAYGLIVLRDRRRKPKVAPQREPVAYLFDVAGETFAAVGCDCETCVASVKAVTAMRIARQAAKTLEIEHWLSNGGAS